MPPKTAAFALANLNKGLSEGYLTTPLHRAARAGDAAGLESLLRDDSKKGVNRRDEIGWQPLLHAACVGQRLSVQVPLDFRAPRDNATRVLVLEEVALPPTPTLNLTLPPPPTLAASPSPSGQPELPQRQPLTRPLTGVRLLVQSEPPPVERRRQATLRPSGAPAAAELLDPEEWACGWRCDGEGERRAAPTLTLTLTLT